MERQVEVVLSPNAVADVHDARDHYGAIREDLVDSFMEGVEQIVDRLQMFPRSGTPVERFGDLRRARVPRFPYGVFYRLNRLDDVRILRVLHDRRGRLTAFDSTELGSERSRIPSPATRVAPPTAPGGRHS
ncbi:hypothetical protein GCM10025883_39250 [Mobilicoccus caccae]|uniref:Type II toxin-antitoxin system RelE/ParE family toxin n=1 Tax=Mobilicoccus caccae TaxID=1859295 RepID=A0ABQ6IX72_9MICO|nr:hypothetical protein GCM10025883_39250 [Mobilicoccus caccae]